MKKTKRSESVGGVPVKAIKAATASLVRRGGAAKSVSQVKRFIAEVETKKNR